MRNRILHLGKKINDLIKNRTKTNRQKVAFFSTKSVDPFSFIAPLTLKKRKWMLVVNSLDVHNSVFTRPKGIKRFDFLTS